MAQPMSKAEWRRRKRRKVIIIRTVVFTFILAVVALLAVGIVWLVRTLFLHEKLGTLKSAGDIAIQAELLTVNDNSRPGNRMGKSEVKGIVIHFTDEPGLSAMEQRNYYEQLASTKQASTGSHFIIGINGEIIQCIPVNEECCANGKHNKDMISIEYCHNDEDGTPSNETYTALVKLTAKLLQEFKLDSTQVYCHNAISDSIIDCPRYFVNNPDKWAAFKNDVTNFIKVNGDSLK